MRTEKTLVLVKPDGVQRGLVGDIVSRFEKKGLKIVGMKVVNVTQEVADKHYNKDDQWCEKVGGFIKKDCQEFGLDFKYESELEAGRDVLRELKKYLQCGPVVAMVMQGSQAVENVRKVVGSTDPLKADVGTIRGDYTIDSNLLAGHLGRPLRNLIHASGEVDEAEFEIGLYFKPEELVKYELAIETILYDPAWSKQKEELIKGEDNK